MASAGEMGYGVRGSVVREKESSAKKNRVTESKRRGVRRRGWK